MGQMRRSGILLYPTELCAEEEATEICMVGRVVALMPSDAVLLSLFRRSGLFTGCLLSLLCAL